MLLRISTEQQLWRLPKGAVVEAGFTSSSGDVRASSVNAKKGLWSEERLETVPSLVK